MRPILRVTTLLLLSTLLAGPAGTLVPVFGDGMAHARGGEGNGGGGDRGGDRGDRGDRGGDKAGGKDKGSKSSAEGRSSGAGNAKGAGKDRAERSETASVEKGPKAGSQGALASGLKGLNAAHASPEAMANAAPNSQVGRIATYKAAVEGSTAAAAAQAELDATVEELALLDATYTAGRTALTEAETQAAGELDNLQAQKDDLLTDYNSDIADLDAQIAALEGIAEPTAEETAELEGLRDQKAATTDAYTAADGLLDGQIAGKNAELTTLQDQIGALDAQYATDTAGYIEEIARLTEEATYDGIPPEEALAAAANGRTLTAEELAYLHDLLGLEPPVTN